MWFIVVVFLNIVKNGLLQPLYFTIWLFLLSIYILVHVFVYNYVCEGQKQSCCNELEF